MSAPEGLLQSADGRRLLAAQLFDSIGAGVGLVALPWLVLDAGGDASTAGLVAVFGLVPYVLFGLFAGVTGDRRSRRRVIVTAHTVQTLCALAVPLWAITGSTPESLVLAVAFAVGVARTFADAAAFGAIAQIVGPAHFGRAQGLLSTVWAAGMVSGPALGGQLIEAVGPSSAIAVQCAAFGLAAACAIAIRHPLRPPTPNTGRLRDAMREGIDVIRDTPVVRRITLTTLCWNLAFYGSEALIVPFLRDVIDLDGRHVGWVLGVGLADRHRDRAGDPLARGPHQRGRRDRHRDRRQRPDGAGSGGLDAPSGRCSRSGSCSAWRSGSASRPRSASGSATRLRTCRRAWASPAAPSPSPR